VKEVNYEPFFLSYHDLFRNRWRDGGEIINLNKTSTGRNWLQSRLNKQHFLIIIEQLT